MKNPKTAKSISQNKRRRSILVRKTRSVNSRGRIINVTKEHHASTLKELLGTITPENRHPEIDW